MRTVELEQYQPPSLFSVTMDPRTRGLETDARWVKLEGFKGEQGEDGMWTLTAYVRRIDETQVESGFQDLTTLLNRVATVRGVDSKRIRVYRP